MAGVERGRVDRLLQVHPERRVVEEEGERPLVLLVPARGAEGQIRLAIAQDQAGRQRGPRPLAGREGVGQPRG